MAFTYDLTNDIGRVRFEIQDTVSATQLFPDAEITYALDRRTGNILLTAADLCGILARRFAGDYDFKWTAPESGAQTELKRSQRAANYLKLETELRVRAGGGLSTIVTTKVDGFSETLSSRDGAGQSRRSGRVRAGYFDPDLPV